MLNHLLICNCNVAMGLGSIAVNGFTSCITTLSMALYTKSIHEMVFYNSKDIADQWKNIVGTKIALRHRILKAMQEIFKAFKAYT